MPQRGSLFVRVLRASGAKSFEELSLYSSLGLELLAQIRPYIPEGDEVAKARALFDWLWQSKPRRYQLGGHFRLTQVLKAQLDPGQEEVGNCLGLTLLYNCLAQELGLKVGAVYLEEAFGHGPHTLSLLHTPGGAVDVENILPQGFDYQGHLSLPREEWGDKELLAELYVSLGNELFQQRKWALAIAQYKKALKLNPRSQKAELNLLMAQAELRG